MLRRRGTGMKKKFMKVVLAFCLTTTLMVTDAIKVKAACEVAQCDYIVRHDRVFGNVKCAKMFYAYWYGIDLFGVKSSAAQLSAQSDLAQHKINCLHL